MFKKPVKIKTNNQVKGSERKNIRDSIQKTFPNLTEDDLNNLLPKKETVNSLKVATATDEIIQVYTVQKRPMFFEVRGRLYPTIYLLWKFPSLVYAFTTHEQVLKFLSSGADLMLPGVMTPPTTSGLPKYGTLQENDLAAVNLYSNQAVIALGVAAQSSASMQRSGGKGRCVTVLHIYGDFLCTLEGQALLPVPKMGPTSWIQLKSFNEDFPALGEAPRKPAPKNDEPASDTNTVEVELTEDLETHKSDEPENGDVELSVEEMDALLHHCFFAAIKYSKNLTLPILTSNFFKLQMLPNCPSSKTLNIKKTSYKKLKPFLDKMSQEKLITIKEMKKGVESIVSINKDHEKFTEFFLKKEDRPQIETKEGENEIKTDITESFIITQATLPIFEGSNLGKGDTVLNSVIKKYTRDYVTKHECQHPDNLRLVKPKLSLETICKTSNPITWEELNEKICGAMKNCFKVTSGQEEILNKGKATPITMSIANRSGNKKVTLIDNLELFGIRVPEFAKECQHGVAASTSISRPPGKKSDQLLVQGNQILFVSNLLTEKYKIPIRYIRGMEFAPKRKK